MNCATKHAASETGPDGVGTISGAAKLIKQICGAIKYVCTQVPLLLTGKLSFAPTRYYCYDYGYDYYYIQILVFRNSFCKSTQPQISACNTKSNLPSEPRSLGHRSLVGRGRSKTVHATV